MPITVRNKWAGKWVNKILTMETKSWILLIEKVVNEAGDCCSENTECH